MSSDQHRPDGRDHVDLRKLAEAATPGPWAYDDHVVSRRDDETWHVFEAMEDDPPIASCGPHGPGEANARFIAAADPQTILALLDERDRLREALDEARQDLLASYPPRAGAAGVALERIERALRTE